MEHQRANNVITEDNAIYDETGKTVYNSPHTELYMYVYIQLSEKLMFVCMLQLRFSTLHCDKACILLFSTQIVLHYVVLIYKCLSVTCTRLSENRERNINGCCLTENS